MPYVRKGKCVYRKNPNGSLTKKGCSSSEEEAKKYLKKLYSVADTEDEEKNMTFDECVYKLLERFE